MPLDPEYRYNANCFAIAPKSDLIIHQEKSETVLPQKNYKVYNIGRTQIFVGLLYGIQTGNYSYVYAVEPGEAKILHNESKGCHTVRLKVINQTNMRAIFHACTADGFFSMIVSKEPRYYDYEHYRHLRETFSIGVKYIPYLHNKFRALHDAYWPADKLNIWEQMEVKLQPLLETHIFNQVRGVLNSYIKNIGERLLKLAIGFENGWVPATDYMSIAMVLTGFEKRLVYKGVTCSEALGLTVVNEKYLKDQIDETINGSFGATKRIADMYEEWEHIVHDTCHPEEIYNSMMNTRSFIALHGLEHSRIWDDMMRNPSTAGVNIYSDVISYSTFFGRPTPNLYKEAIAKTMLPPLTPHLIDNKRNCIRSIDIFLWRKCPSGPPKIGGARITFENDDVNIMGTVSGDVKKIDFNKANIVKLNVTGDGAIDSCIFYMSDERELKFGTRDSGAREETFELKDHHIVSLFLSSDNVILGGQAANIAVAYRLNEICY